MPRGPRGWEQVSPDEPDEEDEESEEEYEFEQKEDERRDRQAIRRGDSDTERQQRKDVPKEKPDTFDGIDREEYTRWRKEVKLLMLDTHCLKRSGLSEFSALRCQRWIPKYPPVPG